MENVLRGSKKWGVLTPKIPPASAPLCGAHFNLYTTQRCKCVYSLTIAIYVSSIHTSKLSQNEN